MESISCCFNVGEISFILLLLRWLLNTHCYHLVAHVPVSVDISKKCGLYLCENASLCVFCHLIIIILLFLVKRQKTSMLGLFYASCMKHLISMRDACSCCSITFSLSFTHLSLSQSLYPFQ